MLLSALSYVQLSSLALPQCLFSNESVDGLDANRDIAADGGLEGSAGTNTKELLVIRPGTFFSS